MALLMLGEIALARRDWPQAIEMIRRGLALRPDHALGHFTMARTLHLSGSAEAKASYETVIRLSPDFALAHSNLAMLEFEAGDNQAAVVAARRAITLAPDLAEAYFHLGRALFASKRYADAETALRTSLALAPTQPMTHTALGRTLLRLGKGEAAVASHRRSLELVPESAGGWSGLGEALRALGRFNEAADCFLRAIELDPKCAAEAHRDLAFCRKAAGTEPALMELGDILRDPLLPASQRIAAAFGLGKALDDLERYDEAFAHYSEANRLSRTAAHARGKRFDISVLRGEIDTQIETFTTAFFQQRRGAGVASELPVFVVGLYRSGTTLTEQILASHPRVFGAGELVEIRHLATELMPQISKLPGEGIRRAASGHLDKLRRMGQGAARVVDKHPDNIFSLGMIATLFPGARVILCRRDARDTALSCYFQQFSEGVGFATDLADCGRRYLETERMAAYWRRVLPLPILEVQYETLVADLEGQARRMIDFIGLDWDPACLSFYETERAVNTFSAWQVRQPIYGSSVGRWRNYERHLGPLFEILNKASIEMPRHVVNYYDH